MQIVCKSMFYLGKPALRTRTCERHVLINNGYSNTDSDQIAQDLNSYVDNNERKPRLKINLYYKNILQPHTRRYH